MLAALSQRWGEAATLSAESAVAAGPRGAAAERWSAALVASSEAADLLATALRSLAERGAGPGLAPCILRIPKHWRLSRSMIAFHARFESSRLRDAAAAERNAAIWENDPANAVLAARLRPRAVDQRSRAAYHGRRRRHWAWVAFQPWRSILSELAANRDPHPLDATEQIELIDFGPVEGIDEADY
jgi:hypothetical protein